MVTNCDGALGKTHLILKLVKGWAGHVLPAPSTGTKKADYSGIPHRLPLLPPCRTHHLPQTQIWLLYSAVLCGQQAHFQNAFLRHTSHLSRYATLLFSTLRIFFLRGSRSSNPLDLTFIKDWERVEFTTFHSVLCSIFVIYKETTATELSYFYLCFIFDFSNFKSLNLSALFHEDFLGNFATGSIQTSFSKGWLSLFPICLSGI